MPEKEKEQDSSARLVRRLAQLKSAFTKKLEETQKARELWAEKLAVDSTGLEYRAFLQKWNSYYLASNFGRAPVETQIAYLTNCLSADLLAKLQFGGCRTIEQAVNVNDVDYKACNPLTVRRLLFSRCNQGKSEAYTDYVIRLEAAHKEADVSTMSPEDIMALQMLGGC